MVASFCADFLQDISRSWHTDAAVRRCTIHHARAKAWRVWCRRMLPWKQSHVGDGDVGHNRCSQTSTTVSTPACFSDDHLDALDKTQCTDALHSESRFENRFTYSAYPVAHGNLLVSFRMRMGRAMWSAEHSISSGDSPRNWGLIYGNFNGSSEPVLPPPPELPPAMIPPINPATADLTRVSMLVVRRGGTSVGRCAAPRLPFPGFPPSSAALIDDKLDGEQEMEGAGGGGGWRGGDPQMVKSSFICSGDKSDSLETSIMKTAMML